MNLYELFLGQIPEAIYFALFLIFTKSLKTKRTVFVTLMILAYVILKQFIHFNVWFQVDYTILTFCILKFLYKEHAQVTDVFTFGLASLWLIFISFISYVLISFITTNTLFRKCIPKTIIIPFANHYKN